MHIEHDEYQLPNNQAKPPSYTIVPIYPLTSVQKTNIQTTSCCVPFISDQQRKRVKPCIRHRGPNSHSCTLVFLVYTSTALRSPNFWTTSNRLLPCSSYCKCLKQTYNLFVNWSCLATTQTYASNTPKLPQHVFSK
jgi:hypothetical protein